jgi:hypothetical protein
MEETLKKKATKKRKKHLKDLNQIQVNPYPMVKN